MRGLVTLCVPDPPELLFAVGRNLVLDWDDKQWGLGFDPDVLLFEELGRDNFARFADGFDRHTDALGRGIKFVCGAVDAACGGGDVVVFGDLCDPADDVLLFIDAIGI